MKTADDLSELTGCEEPRPERAGAVLADRWERAQGSSDVRRRVVELPADLGVDDFRSVGSGKPCGLDGVGRRAECVRAHVADGDSLPGGSGGRGGRWISQFAGRDTTDEAPANLGGGTQLTSGECPSAGDRCARAVIRWCLGLEDAKHPLGAVSSPRGNDPTVSVTECLW